jgi:hypothetical protein
MPTPRRRTPARQPDLKTQVKAALSELIEEERDRADPQRRRDRVLERMEAFLDGVADATREQPGKRRGQREEGEEGEDADEEEDEGPGTILDFLAGGGRRR